MKLSAEEQLAIFDLIVRADQLATIRDVKNYVSLFTSSGQIIGAKGLATGTAELTNFTKDTWSKEPQRTQHLTIAPSISMVSKGLVKAQSTLLIVNPITREIVDCRTIQHELSYEDDKWLFSLRKVL